MAYIGGSPQYITIQQAEQYAAQAGFTGSSIQTIVAIAQAESGLAINAYNPNDPYGGSYGILQINGSHLKDFYPATGSITKAQALAPLSAFQYAYTLSGGGKNFSAWSTYTSGAYKQFLSPLPASTPLPKNGWWTYPRIDNYGYYPDPDGNFPKPDSNILLPANFPIAAILPGTISGINTPNAIHTVPSYGAVITVKLDTPLNSLATHYALLHLAAISPTVSIGEHVDTGQIIAYGGANQTAGSVPAAVGFALTPGDNYGFGNSWVQYNSHADKYPQLNPVPLLDAAKNGEITVPLVDIYAGTVGGSTAGFNLSSVQGSGLISKTAVVLSPTADIGVFLWAIDDAITLVNPVPTQTPDTWSFLGSNPIPDPFEWLQEFFENLASDAAALIFRGLFIALGGYVLFKVLNDLIDITGKTEALGKTAVQIAGAFA